MTIGKELNAIGSRCFRAIKALNQTDAQVSAAVCRCQGDTMKALVLEVQRRANANTRSIDVALQEVSNDLRLGVVVTVSKPAAPLTGPPAFREKRPMRRRPTFQPAQEEQPASITPGEEPPAEPAPEPPTDTEPPSAFDQ